jgi:hypothetical protein
MKIANNQRDNKNEKVKSLFISLFKLYDMKLSPVTNASEMEFMRLFAHEIDIKSYENIIIYESPDLLWRIDNKVFMIEHFSFDATNVSNKGGSPSREKISMEYKLAEEKIKKNKESYLSGEILLHDFSNNEKLSIDNYWKNFENNFVNHYNSYEQYRVKSQKYYKNSSVNEKLSFYFCFCIEDKNPFLSRIVNNRKKTNITPFKHPNIIKLLESHSDLEHVFFIMKSDQDKRFVHYFFNSQDSRDELNSSKDIIKNIHEYRFTFNSNRTILVKAFLKYDNK